MLRMRDVVINHRLIERFLTPFPARGMAGEVPSARPARERLRDLRASCHCTRAIVTCIRDCLGYAFVISRVVLCVPVPSAVSSPSIVRNGAGANGGFASSE